MSLLLEALKKAEKAKEEAQRRAREGDERALAEAAPAPAPEAPKSVVTRDKLPDISAAPIEIASEDFSTAPTPPPEPLPPARPSLMALELEAEAPPPRAAAKPAAPKPAARAATSKGAAADDAAGRASAKKVFEAKFREPNPKMPFYITLGVLGVFAVGTAIYFWQQLRPPAPLVNANPARPAQPETPPAQAAAPTVASAAPAARTDGAIPGLPATAKPTTAAPAPAVPPTRAAQNAAATAPIVAETSPEAPRATPRVQAPRPPAPLAAPERTVGTRSAPQVHPRVDSAYSAYTAGDLVTARHDYEQALREEPANRDALLGLAALEVRAARYEAAEAVYMRLLQADPRDAQAQAALIALRSGRSDPLVTESRVKSMLAADPAAHALNFTLGNQLAQQKRWAEAQQEYFKAYTAEPENGDFAYNLAVSLDHLRQRREALDYYRRAIVLAEKRGASFDLAAARQRAAQLAE